MTTELTDWLQRELTALADPVNAIPMAAYMKTDMPFYGIKRPLRKPIERAMKKRFPPKDRDAWEAAVRGIWALEHREEKYCALTYARAFPAHHLPDSMPLFEDLIRQGAWWDLVDEVAVQLVGRAVQRHRETLTPTLKAWIKDDDVWIRRTAIICQIKHKAETDVPLLLDFCTRRADEKSFWIRKGIGWALRELSKTDPDTVRAFLAKHGEALSGLSRREASKRL